MKIRKKILVTLTVSFATALPAFATITEASLNPSVTTLTRPLSAPDRLGLNFNGQDLRLDLLRKEIYLNEDQTYTQTITEQVTLLTPNGVLNNQSMSSPQYFPKYQSVKLLQAYVVHPDGTKINVPASNLFTTTAPADPDAPGFDTSLVQSVAFPQLTVGSSLFVQWQYKQLTPPAYHYADVTSPSFNFITLHTEMSVNAPASMYLKWAKSGNFQVKEETVNGRRIVSAVLGPQTAYQQEAYMPATSDFLPFFEVSTIKSWQEIANTTWQQVQPSQEVTPEIRALVKQIVGKKTGRDAAQALYNWVASNIYYMAITLNPAQGYIPTPASKVIFNRYTDCKGHANLLQTLLKVIGIDSYPVLVNWDNSLQQYPLPINSFDHEMLYIPSLKLFANPTNLYNPFGSPLEQTNYNQGGLQVLANKPVLMANPAGGLSKTPAATAQQNQYHFTAQMQMDLSGNMETTGTLQGTGSFDSYIRGYLANSGASQAATSQLMANQINGQADAQAPAASNLDAPMVMQYDWQASGVAQRSNGTLIFQLPAGVDFFPSNNFYQFMSPSGTRQYPLIIGAGVYDWNYQLTLPLDYQMQTPPANVNLKNAAGSYVATYQVNATQSQVLAHRTLTLNKSVYSPNEYPSVNALLNAATRDGNTILTITPVPVAFPGMPTAPTQATAITAVKSVTPSAAKTGMVKATA